MTPDFTHPGFRAPRKKKTDWIGVLLFAAIAALVIGVPVGAVMLFSWLGPCYLDGINRVCF